MKSTLKKLAPVIDVVISPLTLISAFLMFAIRKLEIGRMPLSKKILMTVGVFPILDHYYEPLFNPKRLRHSLDRDRQLPGIDFNDDEQLAILDRFLFVDELETIPCEKGDGAGFYHHNGAFQAADAEYLYNMIRLYKPKRIVEIGSGHSTLMAMRAVDANKREMPDYHCDQICIEPYEMPWLEKMGLSVIRKRVETVDKGLFLQLKPNDILFIDSSHVIRPQGDVLFECLEVLPILESGVLVHVHDVFTPRDYREQWILGDMKTWNEQYLLESFLTFNSEYKIIGALNYLKHHHFEALAAKCPFLHKEPRGEPGSFWMARV